MAEEMCQHVLGDLRVCGAPSIPCSKCQKTICSRCLEAHDRQEHSAWMPPAPSVENSVRIEEVQELQKPATSSPFDPLFVDKPPSVEPLNLLPEEPEKPEEPITEEQVGEMFSAEIGRVVSALDLLARRGLNQAAVVALIHDADSKIPKSTILKVLKTLRQLPDLYGRKRPGRKA